MVQVCERSVGGGSAVGSGVGVGGGAGIDGSLALGLGGVCSLGSSSLSSITARFFFFFGWESEESVVRDFFSGSRNTHNASAEATATAVTTPTINGQRLLGATAA